MIIWLGFPENASRKFGGIDKLLELGRSDVLFASQGQLKSEHQIVLDGLRGLEMEVLPPKDLSSGSPLRPKGAIIKARIYATQNQLCEVQVYASKMRITSKDVSKFFDSFEFLGESSSTR